MHKHYSSSQKCKSKLQWTITSYGDSLWKLISIYLIFGCAGWLPLHTGSPQLLCVGFSPRWLLLLWSAGLGFRAAAVVACWFSSLSSRAQLLRGMWDPPRSGIEPMSLTLAGRLSTTVPSGKSCYVTLDLHILSTLLIEEWNKVTTRAGNILRSGILMCVNANTHTHVFSSHILFCFVLRDIQRVCLEQGSCCRIKAMHLQKPDLGGSLETVDTFWLHICIISLFFPSYVWTWWWWWCSVAKSHLTLCDPCGLQCTRLPCPLHPPWICSDSVHWVGDAI